MIKDNWDGLLQNVQLKTVPVFCLLWVCICLSCGLAFAYQCMSLDVVACMTGWFTSVTYQRCLWQRVLVRQVPLIVVPFPRIR